MRFITKVTVQIVIFWDVTPCNIADGYMGFEETCCLRLYSSTLNIDAGYSFDILISI
jgi:hypothetical protein